MLTLAVELRQKGEIVVVDLTNIKEYGPEALRLVAYMQTEAFADVENIAVSLIEELRSLREKNVSKK